MICKRCNKDVPRIKAEKRPAAGGYYYRDDNGGLWHGMVCSPCYARRARVQGKEFKGVRLKKKTTRRCRICKKVLGADRYFTHPLCNLKEVPYGEAEYGGYCQFGSGF